MWILNKSNGQLFNLDHYYHVFLYGRDGVFGERLPDPQKSRIYIPPRHICDASSYQLILEAFRNNQNYVEVT